MSGIYCCHCPEGEENRTNLEKCQIYGLEFGPVCSECSHFWECQKEGCGMHVREGVFNSDGGGDTFGNCSKCDKSFCTDHLEFCSMFNCDCGQLCSNCLSKCLSCDEDYSLYCGKHITKCNGGGCDANFCHQEDCHSMLYSCQCDETIKSYCEACCNNDDSDINFCSACDKYFCGKCRCVCPHANDMQALADQLGAVVIEPAGVYCLEISGIHTQHKFFGFGAQHFQFYLDGILTTDLVFIKFGIASKGFEARAKSYHRLSFNILFLRNFHIDAEKFFLNTFPNNAFKVNFHKEMNAPEIAKEMLLKGEPGLTEWRLVTRHWLHKFRNLTMRNTFDIDTYKSKVLEEDLHSTVVYDIGRLFVKCGDFWTKNEIAIPIFN